MAAAIENARAKEKGKKIAWIKTLLGVKVHGVSMCGFGNQQQYI
jgi:hypothetical protein